jgi:hypothetical protein
MDGYDITREYFLQAAKTESGELARDMAAVTDDDREAMRRAQPSRRP